MVGRRFEVIPPDRCLELLRTQAIGRVAWSGSEGIQVLPVAYTVHESDVLFRTATHGLLAELREPHQVAFEVDRVDPGSHSGWSVVVRGPSRAISDADGLGELWWETDPVPWASGARSLSIAIALRRVSGRVVGGV